MNEVLSAAERERLTAELPVLADVSALREVFWANPRYQEDAPIEVCGLDAAAMDDAAARLVRFAPFLAKAFPETAGAGGIVESPLVRAPAMKRHLEEALGERIAGPYLVKLDSHLPISGSIKARGGVYEVLAHAEALALDAGLLKQGDDYGILVDAAFRDFFSSWELAVGSTGNLGLSVGIIGAKLGFKTTVHMSADARRWKKDLLRSRGVTVVEYDADYSKAVEAGRKTAGPRCHFIDDENSRRLFLGYSVAALRLQKQLEAEGIPVDVDRPLAVYLPCGVGGGPGGVAWGLKRVFGGAVHCYFAEPTHAPSMLIGLATGLHSAVSVGDFGIDNKTCADGLAVGRPSGFVGSVMETLLAGEYTVGDDALHRLVYQLIEKEGVAVEPSAAAALIGPARVLSASPAERKSLENATHIAWATGGSMVPAEEMRAFYQAGKAASPHPYWNARVKSLKPYVPGEQPREQTLIKLNTNENPYPPPPSVVQAMRDASCEKLRLYPDPSCAALRQAIAERHNVEPSRTFAGNGSDEVLALAFGAFFEDAERAHAQPIVFPDVTYSFYPTFARLWNVPYGTAPLQDDWTIRSDDYLAQCGGAVIANPNAPTGIALDPERLLEIAHFQARNNAVVIVDEAYADFGADSVIPRLNSGAHDNILVVKTLSKSHSLAGLRVGYAVGSLQLIAALERMRDSFNSYTLGAVAQAGAAAALREGAYYERTIRAIVATRSRVSADLIGRGFTVLPSSANFIFIKHPQLSGPQFLQRLRERRILARHFDAPRTANHIRVTIGADSDMDAFLDACQ